MKIKKWLYPGIRIKRWLVLLSIGVVLIGAGVASAIQVRMLSWLESEVLRGLDTITGRLGSAGAVVTGLLLIVLGGFLAAFSVGRLIKSIVATVSGRPGEDFAEKLYVKAQLRRGPRIVVMGGGTGLSTLLRGLKHYSSNLTAIVTVADDGGSSGRIRRELGILPPGDIRNTLVALADMEPLMERLFQYRFNWGDGLSGHNFGNLFIAAMTDITGDFEVAIRESSKVLRVMGQVLPSTLSPVRLSARFADGTVAVGESNIPSIGKRISRVQLIPADCEPVPEAISAIEQADAVILGPGSLYTSVLPNLLVKGIADAIKRTGAVVIYVCNVMTQPGETDGFSASDHLQAIYDHVGTGLVDYVLVNNEFVPERLAEKYQSQNAYPVRGDMEKLRAMGVKPVSAPLISIKDLVRHDPDKLAMKVMQLIGESRLLNGHNGRRLREVL